MKLNEIAYFADDVEAMTAFYAALLDTAPVAQSPDMAIFMTGGTKIFIHRTYQPGAGELPPENHIAFTVADVDHSCRALEQAGISIELPPADYYWGRSAYLRAPDGGLIELIQGDDPSSG